MIPKIIHYCWFGGNPLPDDALKYIESWKKFCPDYEIIEWNEKNFDINCCEYVKEAYNAKKWAFVSDYARFKILYKNGGLYFDTDVELIKPIDDIVASGPFMGLEPTLNSPYIAPGLGLAASPGMSLYKDIIDDYDKSHFELEKDGRYKTVVKRVTDILKRNGLKLNPEFQKICGVIIYPAEYFCPLNYYTGEINITENTRSIHHYTASWTNGIEKLIMSIIRFFSGKGKISHIIGYIITSPLKVLNKIKTLGISGTMSYIATYFRRWRY